MAQPYPEQKRLEILGHIRRLGTLDIAIAESPGDTPAREEGRKTLIKERNRLEAEIWRRIAPDPTPWEDLR